jgi:uncharacterized membrane protein
MGVAISPFLGQTTQGGGDVGQLLMWVGILIVAVVIGTIVLLIIRRHMGANRSDETAAYSTMEQMRTMVDRGEMSQQEFEQVRKAMAERIRRSQAAPEADPRENRGNDGTTGTRSSPAR